MTSVWGMQGVPIVYARAASRVRVASMTEGDHSVSRTSEPAEVDQPRISVSPVRGTWWWASMTGVRAY